MKRLLVLVAVSLLMGCAKFPGGGPTVRTVRLIFTMTVDGKLRTGEEQGEGGLPYVYMVALRPSVDPNPTDQGPIPVIAPPWGNGFVSGVVTHFVWWNPLRSPRYGIYKFRDAALTEYFQTGVPVTYVDVQRGDRTLRFELDLTQIADSAEQARAFQSLQVNFLTMDRIPASGSEKLWDALGDGRLPSQVNSPITIPLTTSQVYDNQRALSLEPKGDVPDPDLDIVDWSVEVRIQG